MATLPQVRTVSKHMDLTPGRKRSHPPTAPRNIAEKDKPCSQHPRFSHQKRHRHCWAPSFQNGSEI